MQEVTHVAGEAINEGAYAVGKQVAASKGMFSSFKEEYDKARRGDSAASLEQGDEAVEAIERDEAPENAASVDDDGKPGVSGMFASFKEGYDKARHADEGGSVQESAVDETDEADDGEREAAPAVKKKAEPSKKSSVTGMFAAFKEEYDKARYDDE